MWSTWSRWAGTRYRGSNVAISTPDPSTRAGLMNMVIMGNHSINAAAPTSCGFLRDPSTTVAVHQIQSSNGGNGFLNQVRLYLRKERILRRPPLVCEGGLYGGSCPPLLKAATLSEDPSPHNNNNRVLCAVTIFTTPPIMGQSFPVSFVRIHILVLNRSHVRSRYLK